MKKLIFTMLIVCGFLLLAGNVNAEEPKSEFSFKTGSNIITENGKEVKREKPYLINKVTMIPIDIFKNTFEAVLIRDIKKNTVSLKYSDVEIKFTIKNKIAYVNGIKTNLIAAPEVKNSTVMVPLEFICENFGLEITKENKTSVITVSKVFAGENSIKDFSLILKKTKKDKIGDSYYKWSIYHPKDLKISYRGFNGDYMSFGAVDESYTLSLFISKQKDETIDSVMASELDEANEYTLISQDKETKSGQEYIKTVYNDEDEQQVIENRAFINNGYIYYLSLAVSKYADYKKSSKYATLMDSFKTSYTQNNTIEDLSDVDNNALRTYESKSLKWSIKVPAEFIKSNAEQKSNKVQFYEENDNINVIEASMYSIEKGATLDSWVEHDIKKFNDNINPKLGQILKVEDSVVNGLKSKYVYSVLKTKDKDYYSCEKYMFDKKYRYYVCYVLSSDIYNDNTKKAKFDNIIGSFKFVDPKVENVGQLTDSDMLPEITGSRKVSNKDFKWSIEVPVSWSVGNSNNGKDIAQYLNKDKSISMTLAVVKDKNADEYKTYYNDTLLKQAVGAGNFENVSNETITEKGITIYKYVNKVKSTTFDTFEFYYIIGKNNNLYSVSFLINDMYYGAKNIEIIKAIRDSMKFD
jgi:hypothetical protein